MKLVSLLPFAAFFGLMLFVSCKSENSKPKKKTVEKKLTKAEVQDVLNLDSYQDVRNEKYPNGVSISWHKQGNGAPIAEDHVYAVNYKILINDTVIESSLNSKRLALPFVAGWHLHIKGWDYAMKFLKIGDFATINVPANLVVDAHGIGPKRKVDYVIKVKVLKELEPDRIVDGIKVWKIEGSSKEKKLIDSLSTVKISYLASSKSNPKFDNGFASNSSFSFAMTATNVVPGLKKALINAKRHDKLLMIIPSREAYGNKSFYDYVLPNEQLFYNIFVQEVSTTK